MMSNGLALSCNHGIYEALAIVEVDAYNIIQAKRRGDNGKRNNAEGKKPPDKTDKIRAGGRDAARLLS